MESPTMRDVKAELLKRLHELVNQDRRLFNVCDEKVRIWQNTAHNLAQGLRMLEIGSPKPGELTNRDASAYLGLLTERAQDIRRGHAAAKQLWEILEQEYKEMEIFLLSPWGVDSPPTACRGPPLWLINELSSLREDGQWAIEAVQGAQPFVRESSPLQRFASNCFAPEFTLPPCGSECDDEPTSPPGLVRQCISAPVEAPSPN